MINPNPNPKPNPNPNSNPNPTGAITQPCCYTVLQPNSQLTAEYALLNKWCLSPVLKESIESAAHRAEGSLLQHLLGPAAEKEVCSSKSAPAAAGASS